MISHLSLRNFKGVKQGELPLFPLTILVGTNNAGKTSILEALFLAPNPFRSVPFGDTVAEVIRRTHGVNP